MFNASNWLQRAKIASPEFIGSAECFISKMPLLGLEMFKLRVSRQFSACIQAMLLSKLIQVMIKRLLLWCARLGLAGSARQGRFSVGGPFWEMKLNVSTTFSRPPIVWTTHLPGLVQVMNKRMFFWCESVGCNPITRLDTNKWPPSAKPHNITCFPSFVWNASDKSAIHTQPWIYFQASSILRLIAKLTTSD